MSTSEFLKEKQILLLLLTDYDISLLTDYDISLLTDYDISPISIVENEFSSFIAHVEKYCNSLAAERESIFI
jgi:hypothetical protein